MVTAVQVLRPFMLRRTKREVETELPNKTEHILRCDLSAWQQLWYRQIAEEVHLFTTSLDPCNHFPYALLRQRSVLWWRSPPSYRCPAGPGNNCRGISQEGQLQLTTLSSFRANLYSWL